MPVHRTNSVRNGPWGQSGVVDTAHGIKQSGGAHRLRGIKGEGPHAAHRHAGLGAGDTLGLEKRVASGATALAWRVAPYQLVLSPTAPGVAGHAITRTLWALGRGRHSVL